MGNMRNIRKLVRDNIPRIIKESGHVCSHHTLNASEFQKALENKLKEESQEFLETLDPLELADILEVIEALALLQGVSWDDLLLKKENKQKINGGFKKRVFLDTIE